MSVTNIAGASLIAGGAALVGAMSGWELGPYRLDLTRDQFAVVGASICGIVALAACSLAVERSEARARSRSAMRRLKGLLFQPNHPMGTELIPQLANSHNLDTISRPAGGTEEMARLTASGACP